MRWSAVLQLINGVRAHGGVAGSSIGRDIGGGDGSSSCVVFLPIQNQNTKQKRVSNVERGRGIDGNGAEKVHQKPRPQVMDCNEAVVQNWLVKVIQVDREERNQDIQPEQRIDNVAPRLHINEAQHGVSSHDTAGSNAALHT